MPDIDIDAEGAKREEIIKRVKEKFGEENVLNMGTFTTEGTKQAVLTACRGLGIDKDIAHNIANLIPRGKGQNWTLKECFEKSNDPAVRDFVREVEKYEGLKEAMLAIEGLISGRGQHASGVIIFPNGYIKQNAMMKTTSGLKVTQFDMNDSDYMGGLKLDFLSINALDRIRAAMELLLEYGKIEWQGSLRETYNKYFHPDVLEMEAPEMYDMLFEGHVLNAFQFETNVGQKALTKLNARSFNELCAGNSLMRLSLPEGEQPLDKFIRFKNDISQWYQELRDNGLNDEEIKVLEEHLLPTYGICDSQEGLMMLAMDPRISNYDLTLANKFRKAIAKQDQDMIEEHRKLFYEHGEKAGTRKEMLDYVWNYQFKPMFGYAFSRPHTAGYTLILMIEMNICYRYGPVFWKTACLSVNAGLIGENTEGTDYGAIAKAVGDMKDDVLCPDINLSKIGFTPLEKEGKILFGLKAIAGLGMDAIEKIIENRPYTSLKDFIDRVIKTGLISPAKGVILIKAGCFDRFNPDRRQLMIEYVREITPKREKITMTQLPQIIHLVDKQKFAKELQIYELRNKLFGRNKQPMTKELEQEFLEFLKEYPLEVKYEFVDGKLKVDQKTFDKVYKELTEPLREWVSSKEAADLYNKLKMQEFWKEHCLGSIESWEMETLLFYSKKHELDYMPLNKYFKVSRFSEIPTEPQVIGYKKWGQRQIPQYQHYIIAGTVIEKVKRKSLVYLLTQDGVVMVKYSQGAFSYYDKKVVEVNGKDKKVIDPSWFDRGTKLVIAGIRRGEEFIPKPLSIFNKKSTIKIVGYDQDNIYFQMEKVEG